MWPDPATASGRTAWDVRIEKGFHDSDRPAVAALYWEAFGSKLGTALGPRDRALDFLERMLSPDHAICARDGDGTLLGVVGFKTFEGALVGGGTGDMIRHYGLIGGLWRVGLLTALQRDVENRRFLMDGLFVAAHARSHGIGSRLIEAVAAEGRARGYTELRLDVIEENTRARALYERRGFTAIGSQSTGLLRLAFGFRSAITMVRPLA